MDASDFRRRSGLLDFSLPRDGLRFSRYGSGLPCYSVSTVPDLPPFFFSFHSGRSRLHSVGVMKAAPPDKAGVVGATLQTAMHTSTVIALSIQAGLLTTHPGGIHNHANIQASWYFELGWVVLWLIGFMVFYKSGKHAAVKEDEDVLEVT